jgi:hypothetical protein
MRTHFANKKIKHPHKGYEGDQPKVVVTVEPVIEEVVVKAKIKVKKTIKKLFKKKKK